MNLELSVYAQLGVLTEAFCNQLAELKDLRDKQAKLIVALENLSEEKKLLKEKIDEVNKPAFVMTNQTATNIARNFIGRPTSRSFEEIMSTDCLRDRFSNSFLILEAMLRELMIKDREQPKSPEKAADIAKADRAVEQFLKRPSNSGFTDIMGSCGFNGESQTLSYHILATVLASILTKRYAHCKGRPSKAVTAVADSVPVLIRTNSEVE